MDNGRLFQVNVTQYDEPRSLNAGDRVRVTGWNRNNVFYARNIEFLRDSGNYNTNNGIYGQTTLTGVVTRDLEGNNFELRGTDGRTYRVRINRRAEVQRNLRVGDRVRLTGNTRNNVFVARTVEFVRSTDYPNNGTYGQTTLTGVVTHDLDGNSFEIRATDGRVYRVDLRRGAEPRTLDRGDRVRVTGRLTNNVFIARDIDLLEDTTNNNNNGRTTLTGVVTRDLSGDSFELRADDGRTYQVDVRGNDEPRSLDRGDRVRVTGRLTSSPAPSIF